MTDPRRTAWPYGMEGKVAVRVSGTNRQRFAFTESSQRRVTMSGLPLQVPLLWLTMMLLWLTQNVPLNNNH